MMALFHKLFTSKKRHLSIGTDQPRQDFIQKCTPPRLDKSKIRLVIFSESDRGRTPYFDSNAIKPYEEPSKQNIRQCRTSKPVRCLQDGQVNLQPQKTPPRYHFHRLGNDVKVLEEMMFGSAAMAFKGSTLKIHLLRSPPQLMVSKVFIPEKPCRENTCDTESDCSSLPGSSADFSSGEFSLTLKKPTKERLARSIPVDVPSKDLISDYSTDDDSGLASFTSSGSLRTSSYPSPNNNSISSYSSLHRRWMRAQITSLDGHHRRQDNFLSVERSVNRQRRNKVAIGILFGSHDENDEENYSQFQNFFFSHFALIEGHVEKLRSTVETAYFNSRNFLPATMEALDLFRNDVYDLYMAPRLAEPVWLTMMSAATYKTKLCEKFMETFTWLVGKFDNKNCKFFISTLLSAVLTQHLAWVATVTPAGGTPAHTYQDKHSAKWVDTLAKTHPYNPLWAQLGDLFGAIGVPRKISRTVIFGKKADIVKKLLYIFSYFIRCSEVHENTDPHCLNFIVNEPYLDISLSPTSSEKTLLDNSTSSGLGSVRKTPTLSGGSCGGRTSASSDTQSMYTYQKHSHPCDSISTSTESLSVAGGKSAVDGLHVPKGLHCGNLDVNNCQNGFLAYNKTLSGPDTLVPTKTVSEDSCAIQSVQCKGERIPFVSNCALQSSRMPNSSHQDYNEVFHSHYQPQDSPPIGMSELHNDIPSSLPFDKSLDPPPPHYIPSAIDTESSGHVADTSAQSDSLEQVVRSSSFSGGKFKSRLAQQLETDAAQGPSEASKIKAAEIRLFLGGNIGQSNGHVESVNNQSSKHQEVGEVGRGGEVPQGLSLALSTEGKKEGDGKHLLSRQTSHHGRPTTLARHQSVTPTDLGRRRHLSSTGSIDYEAFDPMIHCKEVKMPFALEACGQWHVRAFDRNFGRSLLAGYSDRYLSDFVLHGTCDADYRQRLLNDLQTTVKHSILDEPIDEAVCVIADTDSWTVEVASSKVMGMSPSGCTSWTSSKLVADLIESVVEISRLKMSAEFCLMHLEDRLQEIYFKSLMLSEYLTGATTYSQRELTSMLGFETSDMALLMAVAGTHTPGLVQMLSA